MVTCIIYKHTNFIFSQKGLYPGGLISKGAYDRRDLYISNLVGLYPGLPVTGRAYDTVIFFDFFLRGTYVMLLTRIIK